MKSFDRVYTVLAENNWSRTITARKLGIAQQSVTRIIRIARERGIPLAISLPMNERVLPIPQERLEHAIRECNGVRAAAARYLNVSTSVLYKYCNRYGIPGVRSKESKV